jgi:hypothetical protein
MYSSPVCGEYSRLPFTNPFSAWHIPIPTS